MTESILQTDDLTEQAMAFMEPFKYDKAHSIHYHDDERMYIQAQTVASRYKQSEVDSGSAIREHMEKIKQLHVESPIVAVLGGLVNGFKLNNDEYAIVSYIFRKGVFKIDDAATGNSLKMGDYVV
jgi:hypothetical protein